MGAQAMWFAICRSWVGISEVIGSIKLFGRFNDNCVLYVSAGYVVM